MVVIVEVPSSVCVNFKTKIIHYNCHSHISLITCLLITCLILEFIISSSHDLNPFLIASIIIDKYCSPLAMDVKIEIHVIKTFKPKMNTMFFLF